MLHHTKKQVIDSNNGFFFHCHERLSCFKQCCKNAEIDLYPYDIIRIKNNLGISSEAVLENYTTLDFEDNPYFPRVLMKMTCDKENSCPFLCETGCAIYIDRPFSCRAYPLERITDRKGKPGARNVTYQLVKHPWCMGHEEPKQWVLQDWIQDQDIALYNEMNDYWIDVDSILRSNPWGSQSIHVAFFRLIFTACYNCDNFSHAIHDVLLKYFDILEDKLAKAESSDIEMMKFGFECVQCFFTGKGPLVKK